MLVDREGLLPSSSSIDQPYSMRLSFLERELCEGALFVQGRPSLTLEQLKLILPLIILLSEY